MSMTGLLVSLDGGVTWVSSDNVRVLFHDATEDDDEMQDMLVNISSEGMILDVIGQGSGEVSKTACMDVDALVELTV